MFTLFVLKTDKSGLEYCARKGRAVASKDRGLSMLNAAKKGGVLLDVSGLNPAGLSHLDTFLKYGAEVVACRGMPALEATLALK